MTRTTLDAHNIQVIRVARALCCMPFLAVRSVYRWARGLFRSGMSVGALREEDQLRQSRARRTLRGLPPDHDAGRTPAG